MSKEQNLASSNQQILPIQLTDALFFDDAFSSLKARLAAHMKLIDDEMTKISKNLQASHGTLSDSASTKGRLKLDFLSKSPLVEGEGENRKLKLQFDVSQFDASEVTVTIENEKLTVSATHEEKTDNSFTVRQYHREFHLPRGVDPDTIVTSLSKDGVLVIETPLPTGSDKPLGE